MASRTPSSQWDRGVGAGEGGNCGAAVVGHAVGTGVGPVGREDVGVPVGANDGSGLGRTLGAGEGSALGNALGAAVDGAAVVGGTVGVGDGPLGSAVGTKQSLPTEPPPPTLPGDVPPADGTLLPGDATGGETEAAREAALRRAHEEALAALRIAGRPLYGSGPLSGSDAPPALEPAACRGWVAPLGAVLEQGLPTLSWLEARRQPWHAEEA